MATGNRLFQVHEGDLCELERILPQLAEALTPDLTARLRVQLRRCQTILSNVRWGYGPPTGFEAVDAVADTDPST